MKGMAGFVIGLLLGAGILWLMIGGSGRGGREGDAILKVSAKDTVIVSAAKYDTVIVSVRKDTVIVSVLDTERCKRVPRPPDCPPVVRERVVTAP